MNAHEKELLARLESMTLEEARIAIHTRAFGDQFGSPNHDFCLSWLACEEAAVRDAREASTLAIAKDANTIALSAASSASDANDIARSAKKHTLIAAIAAVVAAIAAIKWR